MTNDIEVDVADGERNVLACRMIPDDSPGVESASFVYNDNIWPTQTPTLDPAVPLVTGTLQTPVGHALFGGSPTVCQTGGAGRCSSAPNEPEPKLRQRPRAR